MAALALFSLAVVSCAEPLTSPAVPRDAAVRSRTAARSQQEPAGSTAGLMSTTTTSVCALTATNTMYCWGANDRARLGAAASAPNPSPVLSGVQGLQLLSTGTAQHVCGITAGGVAECWGRGGFGQLGGGIAGSGGSNSLTTVVGSISWSSITRGRLATCGVSTLGVGYCWGANQSGEIGNASLALTAGASPSYPTPQLVDGGLVFKSITKGSSTVAASLLTARPTAGGTTAVDSWDSVSSMAPFGRHSPSTAPSDSCRSAPEASTRAALPWTIGPSARARTLMDSSAMAPRPAS